MTNHAAKVTIVHRREGFRASQVMMNRAHANPKIDWQLNSVITEVVGRQEGFRKFVTGVKLQNVQTGTESFLECDGVFMAIGHKPNTGLFSGVLTMDEVGYILTEGKSSKTNIPGVFACGDCQDPHYRQAITSAGSGCVAAIDAERFLNSQQ